MQSEKAEYEKTFNEKSSKELEDSVAAAKAEAAAGALKEQHDGLLLISQFLRLAAIRRGDEEADAALDENKALEGVLAKVYTGDEEAVQTMLRIIRGSDVPTVSVNSEVLNTTCKFFPRMGFLTNLLTKCKMPKSRQLFLNRLLHQAQLKPPLRPTPSKAMLPLLMPA